MNAARQATPDTPPTRDWLAENQRWMVRAQAALRLRITAAIAASQPADAVAPTAPVAQACEEHAAVDADFVPALDHCAHLFGLSAFEREILLLTAGVELDSALRRTVAQAQAVLAEREGLAQPSFALAVRVLAQPHWDALSPQAPLRRWHLVELEGQHAPAQQPLRMDERVLHYLTGTPAADERLFGLARLEPCKPAQKISPLAGRIAQGLTSRDARLPLVLLAQDRGHSDTLRGAALQGLDAIGMPGLWLHARDLPQDARALADTARFIDREAVFTGSIPVVALPTCEAASSGSGQAAVTLVSHLLSPVLMLGAPDPGQLAWLSARHIQRITVPELEGPDLRTRLRQLLPGLPDAAQIDLCIEAMQPALQQFRLSEQALQRVLEEALPAHPALPAEQAPAQLAQRVWQECRHATRGGLEALAQRIESRVRFDDLVLPQGQLRMLQDIAEHLRHRHTVYERWGMGGMTARGQGLCALFAGESGTGKTLAAEAVANEAGLDLYRIDLATVVSKYIGETEKNLKQLFDAAEDSGAVLLFDEADALFGKRSDVKDSHDRYANIEVAYLLQRIEAYRGLAVLTTNQKSALDRAFLRRIRFVVNFPFPDLSARRALWRKAFPAEAPVEGLDLEQLARLPLSGGAIRNVALHAAFVAAARGTGIDTSALAEGARLEYAKNDRPGAGLMREVSP